MLDLAPPSARCLPAIAPTQLLERPLERRSPFARARSVLLAQFVEMAGVQEHDCKAMSEHPSDAKRQRAERTMAAALCQTATKLRLAVRSVDRRNARLDEEEPSAKKTKADVLFGGNVVRF
jgi:hypothetical protein